MQMGNGTNHVNVAGVAAPKQEREGRMVTG